jgi:hypothetical protein
LPGATTLVDHFCIPEVSLVVMLRPRDGPVRQDPIRDLSSGLGSMPPKAIHRAG